MLLELPEWCLVDGGELGEGEGEGEEDGQGHPRKRKRELQKEVYTTCHLFSDFLCLL